MAVDRIETTWHLTPDGWVEGRSDSMWSDYIRTVEPPANRAETWIHKLYQASAYSSRRSFHYTLDCWAQRPRSLISRGLRRKADAAYQVLKPRVRPNWI